MRTAIVATAILLLASACAASSTNESSEGSSAADTAGTPAAADAGTTSTFVQDLKHAYETTGGTQNQDQQFLTDVKPFTGSKLKGAAKEAWEMYDENFKEDLQNFIGDPIVESGTFEGTTVLYVAGDDSDTGSELGFYDEDGSIIAVAYTGQGEEVDPHEGGVDWNQ